MYYFEKEVEKGFDPKYKVYPRSKVEKLVIEFIEEHKIYAQYGKDSEGLFNVQFLVKEEN